MTTRALCDLDPPPALPIPSDDCPAWNPGPGGGIEGSEGPEFCGQQRRYLCCYRKGGGLAVEPHRPGAGFQHSDLGHAPAVAVVFLPWASHDGDGVAEQAGIYLSTETYWQLQDVQSWPGQDVISRVNALAEDTVLLSDPLSEAPGPLSLDKACSFLSILERVLVQEPTLGPAALLAVLCFLKRASALGAGEPEPLEGPWEQLGRGIMSVISLVLEEQLAGVWLSIPKVPEHTGGLSHPLLRGVGRCRASQHCRDLPPAAPGPGLPQEVGEACLCFLELQYKPRDRGILGHYRLLRARPVPGLSCLLLQPQHQLRHPATAV
ncbi:uncharacterized protein LOC104854874 [Fukomys damarensis]|uniref:uncharacterized protein LOC104854874 n=1 Tax=Fukomys damarensis TaxID=885580 RepID=UPI0014556D26|nr:uncharacterized protein LOC104854874 [Fukomys damarensis]